MHNKNKNKINANYNYKTKLQLGILAISVIAVLMISTLYVIQYAYATNAPIITSLIANDPDNADSVYSVNDTIAITFDFDTNEPGGTAPQNGTAINDLFTFAVSLGQQYRGQWTAADTFTIVIRNASGAGPPVIGNATVTPAGITPILSADGTSDASFVTSPVLSGDFGTAPAIQWILLPLTDGIPLSTDCNETEEYGRVMLDAQRNATNTLYLCTASGWKY